MPASNCKITKMCPLYYREAKRKCAEAKRKITWKILQVFNVYIFTSLFIFDLRTFVANLALSQLHTSFISKFQKVKKGLFTT